MEKQKEMQGAHLQLSKSSTEEQLKQYFMGIVELNKSSEEFPINLDDIWPIGYTRRDNAIRDLKNGFYEGEDYVIKDLSQVPDYQFLLKFEGQNNKGSNFCSSNLRSKKCYMQSIDSQSLLKFEEQNNKGSDFCSAELRSKKDGRGGHNKVTYFLSVSCAEYLIVRKCRPAFEVYRRVFHQVVNGGVNLLGMGKYYTIHEYCQMFGKSKNSFYGLIASYRDEFAMIGSMWYISKSLCKMLEMRNNAESIRLSIREKTKKRQLELEFKED